MNVLFHVPSGFFIPSIYVTSLYDRLESVRFISTPQMSRIFLLKQFMQPKAQQKMNINETVILRL